VTAFHVDSTEPGKTWHYYGSVLPKIKFWGKSIQVEAQALLTVELPGYIQRKIHIFKFGFNYFAVFN
jgi:hypothetical protein